MLVIDTSIMTLKRLRFCHSYLRQINISGDRMQRDKNYSWIDETNFTITSSKNTLSTKFIILNLLAVTKCSTLSFRYILISGLASHDFCTIVIVKTFADIIITNGELNITIIPTVWNHLRTKIKTWGFKCRWEFSLLILDLSEGKVRSQSCLSLHRWF